MGSISQSTWHAPESVEFNGTLKLGTKRFKSKIVQKPMSPSDMIYQMEDQCMYSSAFVCVCSSVELFCK